MNTKQEKFIRCPICGNEYDTHESPETYKAVESSKLIAQRDQLLKALTRISNTNITSMGAERFAEWASNYAHATIAAAAIKAGGGE